MYEQFYGLNSRPFQLTPDPHYYFESATHRKALSYLGYGLAQGEGFIVITGDIGAGKTTLVGHLMATIDKARLTAASIVTTQVDSSEIIRLTASHFDLETDGLDKAQLLSSFEEFLHAEARAGRRCLLIVDEAQNLPIPALEELRMLSNFQLGGQSLLQIFLLGQPEFRDAVLNNPSLEQLRQRVIAHHHLEPMTGDEIEPYITHRLSRSGWSGRPKIVSSVFRLVFQETAGVPRIINTLMSRVMLMGAVEKCELIDQDLVGRVLADMKGETVPPGLQRKSVDPTTVTSIPNAPVILEQPVAEPLQPEAAETVMVEIPEDISEPFAMPAEQTYVPEAGPMAVAKAPEVVTLRAVGDSPAPAHAQTPSTSAEARSPVRNIASGPETVSQRLARLEDKVADQEVQVHRVLQLMVNWVEDEIHIRKHHAATGRAA
ncbi:MAG: XrtA/PEP-CTERM system-associated ATPase [Parasphingorhabdus sp.]|nr:XrtA/PEP-CTERM system-associated ATPase [Parasphingorhabdus sp.]